MYGMAGLFFSFFVVLVYRFPGFLAAWFTCLGAVLPMWFYESCRLKKGRNSYELKPSWSAHALSFMPWLIALCLFSWAYPLFDFFGGMVTCLVAMLLSFLFNRHVSTDDDLGQIDRYIKNCQKYNFPWQSLRNISVKAFFLPLMINFSSNIFDNINGLGLDANLNWYQLLLALMFLVDVSFAAAGYLPAPKKAAVEIKSSNPYWDAWVAALVCYPPFWLWFSSFFYYKNGLDWSDYSDYPYYEMVRFLWECALIFLVLVYVWATVVFGPRFSNLTYRGVVTIGPYRLMRHPAYVSKNLFWWLAAMPFIPYHGFQESVFSTLCLLGISGIYWARSVTEERHLLSYSDYRRYFRYILRCGLCFSRVMHYPKKSLRWYLRRYPLIVPSIFFILAYLVSLFG